MHNDFITIVIEKVRHGEAGRFKLITEMMFSYISLLMFVCNI